MLFGVEAGWRPRAAVADARADPALEAGECAAQALELVTQVLVLCELLFDLGDARPDAVGIAETWVFAMPTPVRSRHRS